MSEARSRTFTWSDPALTAGAAAGRTGLELLRAIIAGEVPAPPITATLAFELVSADEGRAVFRGYPAEFHANPMGTVHGGYAATLLDSALGSAVMTLLDADTAYATSQLGIYLTRPIAVDSGPITADARVVHRGRTLATASAELTDERGRLLAHGTTSCALFRR